MKRRFLRPLVKFLKKLTRAGVPVVRACRVAVAVPIASEAPARVVQRLAAEPGLLGVRWQGGDEA